METEIDWYSSQKHQLIELWKRVVSSPDLEAILALEGYVWGYHFYYELLERTDGVFLYYSESDWSTKASLENRIYKEIKVEIDIREELKAARQQFNHSLRGVTLPEDRERGRMVTMYILLPDDWACFIMQHPTSKTAQSDNPLDRLYYAVSF
jgi:hypothetical protein